MTLRGADISNFQGAPEGYRDQPWYRDAQFIICQAIRPPRPYAGWEVGGYTERQLRVAKEDGKYIGIYVWLWHGQTEVNLRADIRRRLDLVPADLKLDMRPWVDVEDTRSVATVTQRRRDVVIALDEANQWAAERELPEAGGYTGKWFVDGYLDRQFPAVPLWDANYGQAPSLGPVLYGIGHRVIHQYTSTPVDLNVMDDAEIIVVAEPEPEPTVADMRQALAYLADISATHAAEVARVARQYGAVS